MSDHHHNAPIDPRVRYAAFVDVKRNGRTLYHVALGGPYHHQELAQRVYDVLRPLDQDVTLGRTEILIARLVDHDAVQRRLKHERWLLELAVLRPEEFVAWCHADAKAATDDAIAFLESLPRKAS